MFDTAYSTLWYWAVYRCPFSVIVGNQVAIDLDVALKKMTFLVSYDPLGVCVAGGG